MSTNPHQHLTLTAAQLDALRDTTRALIKSMYAGDREAYFDAVGPTGYVLTSRGWTAKTSPHVVFSPLCAILDRELIIDAEDNLRDDDGTAFKYVTAEGIWVEDYGSSDQPRVSPQIGPRPDDRTAPGPDADPVLVTVSFDLGERLLWPECWWFDRRTAVQVTHSARLHCDHRIEYQGAGAQEPLEMAIWQTADGRWVGELTAPEELNVNFADEESLWCSLDERYVAHVLYCNPDVATFDSRSLPLNTFVRGIRRAVEELILPTGTVHLHSDEEGGHGPRRYYSEQATRGLTANLNSLIRL